MNSHHRNQARGDPGKTDNPADRSALSRQPQRGTVPLALEVIAMSKRFGNFVALDQVSLRVHTGSMHALLGENGAGKSTLVKCIMGYHRPDDGDLLVWGRERRLANPRDSGGESAHGASSAASGDSLVSGAPGPGSVHGEHAVHR